MLVSWSRVGTTNNIQIFITQEQARSASTAGAPLGNHPLTLSLCALPEDRSIEGDDRLFGPDAEVLIYENGKTRKVSDGELRGRSDLVLMVHGLASSGEGTFGSRSCGGSGQSLFDRTVAQGKTPVFVNYQSIRRNIVTANGENIAEAIRRTGATRFDSVVMHSLGTVAGTNALSRLSNLEVGSVDLYNGPLEGTSLASPGASSYLMLHVLAFTKGPRSALAQMLVGGAVGALTLEAVSALVFAELRPDSDAVTAAARDFQARYPNAKINTFAGTQPGSNVLYQSLQSTIFRGVESDGVVNTLSQEGRRVYSGANVTRTRVPSNHDFGNMTCQDDFPAELAGLYVGTLTGVDPSGKCPSSATYRIQITDNGNTGTLVATWPAGSTESRQVAWRNSQLVLISTGTINSMAYSGGTITGIAPSVCVNSFGQALGPLFHPTFRVSKSSPSNAKVPDGSPCVAPVPCVDKAPGSR